VRPADERHVTNVVLMGMGEPLANFRKRGVPRAAHPAWMTSASICRGAALTLSTSGLVAADLQASRERPTWRWAVSLHAPDDVLRNELVPINRKHPIAELLQACWHYPRRAERPQRDLRIR